MMVMYVYLLVLYIIMSYKFSIFFSFFFLDLLWTFVRYKILFLESSHLRNFILRSDYDLWSQFK